MTRSKHLFLIIVFLATLTWQGCRSLTKPKALTPVLCIASVDTRIQGLDSIDPEALKAYRERGFDLRFDYYQNVNLDILRRYPVVVGMIPQLHAGTRAIDDKFENAIFQYVQEGGGFLLIPAPSYYGGKDFTTQLNPFLQKIDAELLSELPRDPANTETQYRILSYRYLKTKALTPHPVTKDVEELTLPLDFNDSYLRTHTMNVGPEWTVLVRGEKTCETFPFLQPDKAGTYSESPPFLAVRDWGKGKFAILCSASRYFIFDAFHWAHGNGHVLKNGGLRLMSNLLRYLAKPKVHISRMISDESRNKKDENAIPIAQNKREWLDYVISKLKPANMGVKYYIDCGSLSDTPYSPEKGFGLAGPSGDSWSIRWAWSDIFHATASNTRAFDIKKPVYRFDHLAKGKKYALGILLWSYQVEGARDVSISTLDGEKLATFAIPCFKNEKGPVFNIVDISQKAVENGRLDLVFSVDKNGTGTFSSIGELWLFEEGLDGPKTGETIMTIMEPPFRFTKEQLSSDRQFTGLIGAKSNLSSGHESVASLSKAARNAGLSYLVFTEDAKKMTRESLDQLKKQCKSASNADFTAIPGIQLSCEYDSISKHPDNPKAGGKLSTYIFSPELSRLPDKNDYSNPYSLLWKFFGGEFCGGHRAPPNLRIPGKNGISPFHQRFWRGFDLYTFDENDNKVDDAQNLYTDLLSHGYGPYPRISGDYRSAGAITKAAKKWRTVIPAREQNVMPLYHYASYVTNGPLIEKFSISFDHLREATAGEGIVFHGATRILVHIDVSSKEPLKTVTLRSGEQLIRRWYPKTNRFTITEPVLVGRQHEFYLTTETETGEQAVSGRIQTADSPFMIGMCADNQNTICNLTRKPDQYIRDERALYLPHSYWHTGEALGQLGSLVNPRDLVPRIIESNIIQPVKRIIPTPLFEFENGGHENHILAELRIMEASSDYNHVQYRFDEPGCELKSVTDIRSYRPVENGPTIILRECSITANKDVAFKHPFGLTTLRAAMMPPLAPVWKYSFVEPSGDITTNRFASIPKSREVIAKLKIGEGIMIWPSEAGNLLVFPLDTHQRFVKFDNLSGVWNGRERVSFALDLPNMRKGKTVKLRTLVILYPQPISEEDQLIDLRKLLTNTGRYLKKLIIGDVSSVDYPLVLKANDFAVSGCFDTKNATSPIPLDVVGINSSWSCAKEIDGALYPLEAMNDILHTTLPRRASSFIVTVGNPVVSNQSGLRLEWGGLYQKGSLVHLHNPTDRNMSVTIKNNPAFVSVPKMDAKLTISPGRSGWFHIQGSKVTSIEKQ